MKRKSSRKTHSKKAFSARNQLTIYSLLIGISLILLFFFVAMTHKSNAERKVLGVTTGPILLAKGGDDSGSSGGGDSNSGSENSDSSSDSGGSSNSNSSNSGSGSGNSGSSGSSNTSGSNSGSSTGNTNSVGGSTSSSVTNSTSVLCTGPDEKQFQTDFRHCSDLNKEWNHQVSFTVLSRPTLQIREQKVEEPSHLEQENEVQKEKVEKPEVVSDKLEVKTENDKTRINIQTAGTQVRVKIEGDKIVFKAKQENENEVLLEEHDALEKINETLQINDVEIHKTAQNTIAIRNGEVEAETHLPLSIDPLTHELTIETETGIKKIVILPAQAIQTMVAKKELTSVQSTIIANSKNESEQLQKAELTEFHGEVVYKIQGVLHRKVLGIFDVALPRTILTSTQSDEIRKIDESLMSRILEMFSF